jgi:hypothetical protein
MAVQVFDLQELVNKCTNVMPPISGEPFRIRLYFDADISIDKRKEAIAFLRKIGYEQVGNTSSWVLRQKPLETDVD